LWGGTRLNLAEIAAYESYGLDAKARRRLSDLGDLLLSAACNVTSVTEPGEVERIHFLDSLSLLALPAVSCASSLADIGSGGGFPGLILALARPDIVVTAIESQRKKCEHIQRAALALELSNVNVCCMRVEDHARSGGREAYDVAVSRAVAILPTIAEYSLPLLRVGGTMVAMKGAISDQERTRAADALAILGADRLEAIRSDPFEGARDRWIYLAAKVRATPAEYPRRSGVPAKRPLG
jgi:16S rRNA (guanine527-N7)-methyltransferase